MDFSITEAQRALVETVRRICQKEFRAARDTLTRTETLRNLVGRTLVQQMDLASGGLAMGMI